MTCPACGSDVVVFTVPPSLRPHAPGSGETAALCISCLRTTPTDRAAATEPPFEAVHPAFPTGEAGAALALALGLLGSLALRRADIDDCCSHAERAGADVLLTLDRLAASEGVAPHFDADRRRVQLAEMLE